MAGLITRDSAKAVGSTESPSVTPGGVLVVVIGPGDRPIVTAGREPLDAAEIPIDAGDQLAARVRGCCVARKRQTPKGEQEQKRQSSPADS